jgi:hypothetical protein
LEGRDVAVRETVNAGKERFDGAALPGLFKGATKIVVARGKKVLTFDPRKDEFEDIAKVALGPSGNLRAPSLRLGKTWIVGFHEEAYTAEFG